MTIYFLDGKFIAQDEVKISVDDRGYYFGDGVYEVIKVYRGELFTEEEHLERLLQSASKIKLSLPYTVGQFVEIANELIKSNNIEDGHIYMQVTRGVSKRIHHFPEPDVMPTVVAYAVSIPRPLNALQNGVALKSVEDVRWLRCDIKSLNLLGNVLAKQEAHEANCTEALLHRNGTVTEGSSSNMFGFKNGKLYTHPVTNLILNGITRQVVLRLCHDLGIQVVEEAFTLEEALAMDEFFLTSTTSEVTPVISIDGSPIGLGKPGEWTTKLQKALALQIPSLISGE